MKVLPLGRPLLHGTLTIVLLFYSFLPYLGTKVWHAFVPEHQHWIVFTDQVQDNAAAFAARQSDNDCNTCDDVMSPPASSAETVVHAFNPSSDLQVLTIMIGLLGSIILVLPRTLSSRLTALPLLLNSALLIPPDPPPMS